MCGVAGYVGAGDKSILTAMTEAIAHRGPDGQRVFVDPDAPVGLGHRRLVVLDKPGGVQPMWDSDGKICVVFNGEVYNHHALRESLEARGHVFASDHSDTEVLVHGYKAWGTGLLERLNGMFAFALYDRAEQRLVLARDRFGEKPLYYGALKDSFLFGSELTALRAHPAARDLPVSPTALQKFFAHGFWPGAWTPFEGLKKLEPGHYLTVDVTSGQPRLHRYYQFKIAPGEPPGREDQWIETVRDKIDLAVRDRLEADVPLGFFLSGGLDSSTVVEAATHHRTANDLRTFAIGFSETGYDESPYAEQVALALGTRHDMELCDLDAQRSELNPLLARLDEPSGDPSILPTYLLCRFAAEHVTVALSGDGGDELFAGYDPFGVLEFAARYNRWVPGPVDKILQQLVGWLPQSDSNMSLDFRARRGLRALKQDAGLWNPLWLAPASLEDLKDLFAEPLPRESLYEEVLTTWESSDSDHTVDRVLEFYTRYYLGDQILPKTDRAAMLNGLEVRSPFLDYDLVDYVRHIPWTSKMKGKTRKWILKEAMHGRLPADIIHRKKKGFGIPLSAWLRAMDMPSGRPLPNHTALEERWQAHHAGTADHRGVLWGHLATAGLAS